MIQVCTSTLYIYYYVAILSHHMFSCGMQRGTRKFINVTCEASITGWCSTKGSLAQHEKCPGLRRSCAWGAANGRPSDCPGTTLALSRQQLGGNGGPTHSGGRNLTSISASSEYLLRSSKVTVLRVCMNSEVMIRKRVGNGWNHWTPLGPRHPACSPGLVDHRFSEALRWRFHHSQKKCTAAAARIQHLCWDPLALTASRAMTIYEAMNLRSTTKQGFEIRSASHVLFMFSNFPRFDMCRMWFVFICTAGHPKDVLGPRDYDDEIPIYWCSNLYGCFTSKIPIDQQQWTVVTGE